jgi:hypothetical protein
MQEHDTVAGSPAAAVELAPPLTIRQARETADAISAALATNEAVSLVLPDVGPFDLAFVQVVEAARLEAAARGQRLSLAAPASGDLLQLLERAGFAAAPSTSTFWTGNGVLR